MKFAPVAFVGLVLVSATCVAATPIKVMSLNVYGWATMPAAAPEYAALIREHDIDVLGIQEGAEDWQIEGLPTDYSRSEALVVALGECWRHRYQVFYNTCRGVELVSHDRFDMTDGPNAVRTGELAVLEKKGGRFAFVDVHWDHESAQSRKANAHETATSANHYKEIPTIVLGDFNSSCTSQDVTEMARLANMELIVDGGIDCIFSRGAEGSGSVIEAEPSDHPGVIAIFKSHTPMRETQNRIVDRIPVQPAA